MRKTGTMRKVFLTGVIFLLAAFAMHAQQPVSPNYLQGVKIDNDTIPHVDLPQVIVFPKTRFKSKQEEQQYWRLVWKVKKVYPYVKEASRLYQKYQQDVPQGAKRRDRRIYIKKAEGELMALYGPKLKKLTISEGQILIKLIDRETHSTSYDLIDNLKGGVPAVFWQGVARLFGNNLKSQYEPHGEDRQIEQIILYIEAGIL